MEKNGNLSKNGNGKYQNNLNLGEIGTIRNILMGEQLTEYELKFRELEEQISNLKSELFARVQETNKHNKNLIVSLENKVEGKITTLEQNLGKNKTAIDTLKTGADQDRQQLGKLLIELGNKLVSQSSE